MWAIYNPLFGFYYDAKGTRREAIASHVKDKGYDWKFCKKRGDVCIKVVVSAQRRVKLTSRGRRQNFFGNEGIKHG